MTGPRPTVIVLVAGTGTDVGKTWVAARLLEAWRRSGRSVAARKPAQSFAVGSGPTDAEVLGAASGEDPLSVCPPTRSYPVAFAPPMAASVLGLPPPTMAALVGELAWPDPGVDVGLVETAGGVRSPQADDGDVIDMMTAIVPDHVVLVADAGLGTINAIRLSLGALSESHHHVGDNPGTRNDTDHAHSTPFVVVNRFDPSSDLHRRNRAWMHRHDGIATIEATPAGLTSLAARLAGIGPMDSGLTIWSPGDEDDLPELPPGGETLVGLVGALQRERGLHRNAEPTRHQVRQDMGLDGGRHRRLFEDGPRPERRARDPRPPLHQAHEIDLGARAAPHADHRHPPADGQGTHDTAQARPAHELQHGVERAERQGLGRIHGMGRPEGRHRLAQCRRTHRRHRRGAGHGGQLHTGRPHPAGGRRDEHPVTHGQAALGEQRIVGGGERLRKPARLRPGEPLGNSHRTALVDQGQLGLGAAAHHPHDTIADGETRRPCPDGHHLARHLETGDVGRHPGRRRVEAEALEQIGRIDPRGAHVHHDLGITGHRVRLRVPPKIAVDDGDGPHATAR